MYLVVCSIHIGLVSKECLHNLQASSPTSLCQSIFSLLYIRCRHRQLMLTLNFSPKLAPNDLFEGFQNPILLCGMGIKTGLVSIMAQLDHAKAGR